MLQVIQYQKTGEIFVEDLPRPKIKNGGVLIRNVFSLISAGTERTSVETAQASMVGKARSRPDLVNQVMDNVKREGWVATYKKVQNRLDNYKELGYSSAGIVVESSVDVFKPGDRVACGGVGYASHAEMVFVPKHLVTKIPENVSFGEASFTTVASIALQGVRQADVRIGENVAVIGLGLIGLITVELLEASSCRVIGLDISENNLDIAKRLGCDECFVSNYDAIQKIALLTKGYGTDAVIITAATKSNDPIKLALEFARKKSKVIIVGTVGMNIPKTPFYEKELDLRISCSYGPGRYDPLYEEKGNDYPIGYVRWTENRNMEAVLDLIAQKKLDVKSLITHTFKIEDALEAYDLITEKVKEKYLGILIEYPRDERNGKQEAKKIVLKDHQKIRTINKEPIIGFIGAGNFAQSYLIPSLRKLGVKLKGVVSSTPVNSKSVGNKFNFDYCATDTEEILNDQEINTVFIATRHDSHSNYVIESLKSGKNVFVEKPLAINEQQLNRISNIYQECLQKGKQPFLMVGYNRRFSRPVRAIKDYFKGRKESLVMNYRVNAGFIPKTNWYQDIEQGGRIIGEVCHFIDTMQFICDATPISVFTTAPEDIGRRYSSDNVVITINFSDGSAGTICYLANGAKALGKEYFEVFGEGKTTVMENFKKVRFFNDREKWKKRYSGDKGHFEEMARVSETIKHGKPSPISIKSLIATTHATFAVVESLNNRSVVILK